LGYNLRIVLKWLLIFVGVSALTVTVALVACKYERTREDQQRASTKLALPSAVAQPESANAAQQRCDCTPQAPCWYVLLAWPEGMTVWVVILTFAVIGWQADETRKAAQHMGEQTGILKQSTDISKGATVPTLRMLKFNMSGSDPLVDNEMELTVRNYGSTPAILDALYISFDDGERCPTEGTPVAYTDKAGRAVTANSEGTLYCSPTICLVSPPQIQRFRTELKPLYAHGQLKYLDVFESPVRSLRFDVCLRQRQDRTIYCEIIGQWNEYERPEEAN
jgi:hypothetical protein